MLITLLVLKYLILPDHTAIGHVLCNGLKVMPLSSIEKKTLIIRALAFV